MSATAWSTKAAPLAGVAGSAALALGIVCIVHAATVLALGGAAWNLPAHACMLLAILLAGLRVARDSRRGTQVLYWDDADGGFRMAGHPGVLAPARVWHGPGWVALRLQCPSAGRPLHLAVWKSAIPAPLWSELALRIQAAPSGGNRHQNKENP